jgi:hypothetical protein
MTSARITDEAVEAAAKAIYETPHDGLSRQGYSRAPREIQKLYLAEARAALEAALPHLAPQPVVDREALEKALRAELVQQGVDEFHDPMPLARQLTDAVLALINGSVS